VRLLQDGSGLFWHFFLERTGRPYGRAWGRGQGWALLGLLDLLEHVPSGAGPIVGGGEIHRRPQR
jgi:unsaturated rhamnogalacturonyl hydrolase